MYIFKKDSFFYLVLAFIFSCLVFMVFTSKTTYDLGDGVQHYLISRFSFAHPALFLDHWGKPFFTLITSPFAQFGMKGLNLFNIFCCIISAFVCYRIAQIFEMAYSWPVAFFIAFSPMWFVVMNSGLTEPLFACMTVISIWLLLKNKVALSLIILSFLPFVRNEGILFFPLFFIILIKKKQIFLSPYFLTGFVLYSLIGGLYFDDFLWVFTKMSYGDSEKIYGSLSPFHFIKNSPYIFGGIITFLIVSGIAWLLFRLISKSQLNKTPYLLEETLLVYGCFLIYFIAHSIFAVYGSLGLPRIMAGIIPLAALVALRGFNLFAALLDKNRILKSILASLIIIYIVLIPFKKFWPFTPGGEEPVIEKAGDWINSTDLKKNKFYYLHPYITLKLDIDPFDPSKSSQLWNIDPKNMDANVPDGSVIIWDAHFGPNECSLPLESFLTNPHYKLLQTFKPDQEFFVLGGYSFAVYIFQKI